jgi:hypothetical protein
VRQWLPSRASSPAASVPREEGVRAGQFRPLRLELVPHLFIAAIRGLEIHFAEMKGSPSTEEGLDELMELLFSAICR